MKMVLITVKVDGEPLMEEEVAMHEDYELFNDVQTEQIGCTPEDVNEVFLSAALSQAFNRIRAKLGVMLQ